MCLWVYLGNHGTHRKHGKKHGKNTKYRRLRGLRKKHRKPKDMGFFRCCGDTFSEILWTSGGYRYTNEASHFLRLSVFFRKRSGIPCFFPWNSVCSVLLRGYPHTSKESHLRKPSSAFKPWLSIYVQRPARKVSTCIEKSIIRHLCVSRSDRLILRNLSNSHTPKNWCDASGCTTGKN